MELTGRYRSVGRIHFVREGGILMFWLQTALVLLAVPGNGDTVLLDFYTDGCLPCRRMAPVVQRLADEGYPVRRINGGRNPAIAQQYGVTAFPTFILVSDGRVVDGIVGMNSYDRLLAMFHKASALKARRKTPPSPALTFGGASSTRDVSSGAMTPVASGPLSTRSNGNMVPVVSVAETESHNSPSQWVPMSRPVETSNIAQGPIRPVSFSQPKNGPTNRITTAGLSTVTRDEHVPVTNAQLIASTVRLRIKDPNGYSCGTGTIIDARDGWALILTCGHLFRDSKGKGAIDVDLFGPKGQQRVRGELLGYDSEKRDLGLLRICVPGPVCVAPVAPPGYQVAVGSPVASSGCSNGADPTVMRTRIRAKNKFVGPPNFQADGLPVEGRSGGGLFSAEGYVIGVCNAADPTDNAGLYAALASIHAQLDQQGLDYIYRQRPERWTPTTNPTQDDLVAVRPPNMPTEMPAPATLADSTATGPIPTSSHQRGPIGRASSASHADNLSPAERAALDEIRRRKAQGAEVICIIRSPNDPTGKSEILRLGDASPAFLERLSEMNP